MRYRTATLMARRSLGTSGTHIEPIRIKDPISQLIVVYEVTTTAIPRLAHDSGAITKFEIVDGSDVLCSLDGEECNGLPYFEGMPFLGSSPNNITAAVNVGKFTIPFGRYKHDPLLALDPSRFENPQIRITFNALGVEASASAFHVTLIAETFDEHKISPIGFLQHREWHKYLTANTSTYTYVNIPTDLPIRKMFFRPYHSETTPTVILSEVKLSEDNDKIIPFDMAALNLYYQNFSQFGPCHEPVYGTGHGAGRPAWTAITGGLFFSFGNLVGTGGFQLQVYAGGKMGVLGATATDYWMGYAEGGMPHHMICYPFGNQQDPDDWYDVTKLGDLRLRYYTGDACPALGTIATLLQQFRRY